MQRSENGNNQCQAKNVQPQHRPFAECLGYYNVCISIRIFRSSRLLGMHSKYWRRKYCCDIHSGMSFISMSHRKWTNNTTIGVNMNIQEENITKGHHVDGIYRSIESTHISNSNIWQWNGNWNWEDGKIYTFLVLMIEYNKWIHLNKTDWTKTIVQFCTIPRSNLMVA